MKNPMNWVKAKHRIDSGRTRDKVNYPDPAAAPLGTDEEAGGARTPPEDIERAIGHRDGGERAADENTRK